MVTYKNIRIKKRGGGTRLQRVHVLASGKYKFVKNLTKSKSRSTGKTKTRRKKRRSNPSKKGGRSMAKGKSLVQTAYKLIPAVALAAPTVNIAMSETTGKQKIGMWVRAYTGYSMSSAGLGTSGFNLGDTQEGWLPFVASKLIVLGVQKISGLLRKI